ncbi:Ribonuclease R [Mariniblastus fucicola]|uniref:Ribonuclease R n=2 Tax=Mariniblastus fucicola TaxID=980251 RepID=A0A5B9PDB6_9BACT|nr:Ribonuclease R [Mariniblastus fucicola]
MVLDLVLDDSYQPLKSRAIAKKLDLLDDEREVKRAIKRLIRDGDLRFGDKHLVMKPSKPKKPGRKPRKKTENITTETGQKFKRKDNEIVGTFRKTSGGFGFVTPEDSIVTDRSEDIFVPRSRTGDAAHLDKVIVRIPKEKKEDSKKRGKRKESGRGPAGRIVRVIERYTHRFVGTYQENEDYGIVVVDSATFEHGILVGDAGAKACKVGDKVVIEMANFPSAHSPGEGVIVEVLGDRGQPGVDTRMVIAEYGLPEEFPEAVLEDARRQAEAFDETIGEDRTDFTGKTVITIDPKTARDFDDAISLEQIENGHWQLGVHIADVSHFVPFRSALDAEAYARSTSVYLPDKVIPMLPEIISNNLASLQPDRIRYCMTALIEFTDEGVPIGTELHRGAIKSAHRFNYEEIDEYLEDDQPWKDELTPEVFGLVRNMHTLAMKLRKRRMDRGAINLVLPEVRIDLDDDGKVSGAHTEENTESHQVIEEFMLAANEAVAQRIEDEKLFLIRRIHESPTEKKLQELTKFVQSLGIDCGNLKDRFELKRVVEESESMQEQHAIHFAVLRTMQKAVYSPEEIGHYALASPAYCHFTSPIRRYPDLVIHRMVGDLVDGKKPKSNFDSLAALGKHCSHLEKRAADAERELKKLKLLSFMSEKIGDKLTGVITGVEQFGLFVQGIEIPAEGLIPIESLPGDNYTYERRSRTLSGAREKNQFRLGDQIEVEVAVVDLDKRLLEYRIVGVKPGRSRSTQRGGGRTKDKSQDRKLSSRKPVRDEGFEERPSKERPSREKRGDAKPVREKSSARDKTNSERSKSKDKTKAGAKPKRNRSRSKDRDDFEDFVWEEVRKSGKTRKQREAEKAKKFKSSKVTKSKKSKKVQAQKKKSTEAAKKAARKKKVAAAKAKQKKKGKQRKK